MEPQIDTQIETESVEQYLSFKLGEEFYGINILRVQEIKGWEETTSIPNTPGFIKGVINLRGTVIPILDLRLKFNMKWNEYDKKTVVIVTKIKSEDTEKIMGIVVDSVSDTQNIKLSEISEAPDLGVSINTDYIKGITSVGENMLVILDIDRLINHGVLDSALAQTEEVTNG
ncbi:chemotaxis protein CheW [Alteromonas macleodii]|uniref:chemotaxis protein CheW n=1 Tax=Alteromonas macleodii TaxID=28108 RepID=UPI00313FF14F